MKRARVGRQRGALGLAPCLHRASRLPGARGRPAIAVCHRRAAVTSAEVSLVGERTAAEAARKTLRAGAVENRKSP